ncbi:MAG: manganese efflux pump MntP family protein [Bacteroidales bacterium]|nr:manganese efflux pump MntP family protein [Bacteroidales bacterium]
MYCIEIVLIAVGLSVDSFVVSVTGGAVMKEQYRRIIWKMAAIFALCQGVMTALGYFLGVGMSGLIQSYDHWIAFVLLFYLGSKMIYERLKNKGGDNCIFDPLRPRVLWGLGIATSIDAAAVGISLAMLNTPILSAFLVVSAATFLFSFFGVFLGGRFGKKVNSKAIEIIGGLVLISIGIKILVEHLYTLT